MQWSGVARMSRMDDDSATPLGRRGALANICDSRTLQINRSSHNLEDVNETGRAGAAIPDTAQPLSQLCRAEDLKWFKATILLPPLLLRLLNQGFDAAYYGTARDPCSAELFAI